MSSVPCSKSDFDVAMACTRERIPRLSTRRMDRRRVGCQGMSSARAWRGRRVGPAAGSVKLGGAVLQPQASFRAIRDTREQLLDSRLRGVQVLVQIVIHELVSGVDGPRQRNFSLAIRLEQ